MKSLFAGLAAAAFASVLSTGAIAQNLTPIRMIAFGGATNVLDKPGLFFYDRDTKTKKQVPILRYYTVFNLDQIDGVEAPDAPEPSTRDFVPIEEAAKIVSGMGQRPEIIHKEPRAYYRPSTDTVNLPRPELFEKAEEYYSTAFHELTHATGHETRLNRRPSSEIRHFGDRDYSQEELVAEMGAAFLCAKARIEQATIENSAAYIQGWLAALKGSPKLVVHAAAQAQRAADFILGVNHGEASE